MKTTFNYEAKRLANIAVSYQNGLEPLYKASEALRHNEDYSAKYLAELIAEADKKRDQAIEEARGKMQEDIDSSMAALKGENKINLQNDAAHQMAVANALKMIEMTGEDMEPDQMAGIVKSFHDAGDQQTVDMINTIGQKYCPHCYTNGSILIAPELGTPVRTEAEKMRLFGQRLVRSIGIGVRTAIAQQMVNDQLGTMGYEPVFTGKIYEEDLPKAII